MATHSAEQAPQEPCILHLIPTPTMLLPGNRGNRQRRTMSGCMVATLGSGRDRELRGKVI